MSLKFAYILFMHLWAYLNVHMPRLSYTVYIILIYFNKNMTIETVERNARNILIICHSCHCISVIEIETVPTE